MRMENGEISSWFYTQENWNPEDRGLSKVTQVMEWKQLDR